MKLCKGGGVVCDSVLSGRDWWHAHYYTSMI